MIDHISGRTDLRDGHYMWDIFRSWRIEALLAQHVAMRQKVSKKEEVIEARRESVLPTPRDPRHFERTEGGSSSVSQSFGAKKYFGQ